MKGQEIKGRLDRIGKTALEHFQDIKELEVADEQGLTVENLLPYKCKQVEKSLKALEIIKKKTVDIWLIQNKKTLKQYNSMVDESRQLTEEEFSLLKECLE